MGTSAAGPTRFRCSVREGFTPSVPAIRGGVEHDRRELADGRDLNRCFDDARCAEAERVRASLRERPPKLLLDLHENGPRPYVIQFDPEADVGERLVASLSDRWVFDPRPAFGPFVGRGGVLRPSRLLLWLNGLSRRWSLAYWAHRALGCTALVVEVPHHWARNERLEFHLAVALAAREIAAGARPRPRR